MLGITDRLLIKVDIQDKTGTCQNLTFGAGSGCYEMLWFQGGRRTFMNS